MAKSLQLILGIFVILALAFLYLYVTAPIPLGTWDDATVSDRCAQFREYDEEDKDVYSLGYSGRIRQLLNGCF